MQWGLVTPVPCPELPVVKAKAVAECDHFYCVSALSTTSPFITLHFWELLELCCSFGQRTSPGTHALSMVLPWPDLSKVCKRAGAEELRHVECSAVSIWTHVLCPWHPEMKFYSSSKLLQIPSSPVQCHQQVLRFSFPTTSGGQCARSGVVSDAGRICALGVNAQGCDKCHLEQRKTFFQTAVNLETQRPWDVLLIVRAPMGLPSERYLLPKCHTVATSLAASLPSNSHHVTLCQTTVIQSRF